MSKKIGVTLFFTGVGQNIQQLKYKILCNRKWFGNSVVFAHTPRFL